MENENEFKRDHIEYSKLWIPLVLALVSALSYNLFVFPNSFAPAGIFTR